MCNLVPKEPKNLTIGTCQINGQVFLAPMSGITDAPFRMIAQSLGAPAAVSEMIASEELFLNRKESIRRARNHINAVPGNPFIIQLAGREANMMAEGAQIASDLGADIIDINMGCPAKKVTGGLSGAALMREPLRALRLIEAVVRAGRCPVSVKMRLGWDDGQINATVLAKSAENAGVSMITVHGRTRCQFYKGKADWQAISKVKQSVSIPVVANGDVTSIKQAVNALSVSGADAVMIGRGAQGQPWLPGQVAEYLKSGHIKADPTLQSELQILLWQYIETLFHYGRDLGVRCARKHLCWSLDRHAAKIPALTQIRRSICTAEEPNQVMDLLKRFYGTAMESTPA